MNNENKPENKRIYYERFNPFTRFLHVLIIISFVSLAITGMCIKFSGYTLFQEISNFFGGYIVSGFVHRFAAVITFIYFILHFINMVYKKVKMKQDFSYYTKGEHTMLPRKIDVIEFFQTIKWFVGLGPRPQYGRWTYWEKFDYFAVMWGVAIIGGSGLLLWFPEFFTSLGVPGKFINVATIIHSDEALLATGFIFSVHFYNTHFRPDKFPMDTVIFTGKMSLEELKHDRPREYAIVTQEHDFEDRLTEAPPGWFIAGAKFFGFCALSLGVLMIVLIIYTMVFLYN